MSKNTNNYCVDQNYSHRISKQELKKLKEYFKNNSIDKNDKVDFRGNSSGAKNYFENTTPKKQKRECDTTECQIITHPESSSCENLDGGLELLYYAAAAAFGSEGWENESSESDDENELNNRHVMTTSSSTELKNKLTITSLPHHERKSSVLSDITVEINIDAPCNVSVPCITFSPKNPYYPQMNNESRLDYLCRVPSLLQAAINSYNLEKVKYVINDAVSEDCILKSASLNAYSGRNKWYDQLETVLNCVPDFYVANTQPMLFRRCIVFKQYSYGTTGVLTGINNNPKKDFLWNIFKATPIEKMDDKMRTLKIKYDKCISEGKLIRFVRKVILFYMLNKEMTHFEQRVSYCESLELYEANVEDFFKD